jgi:hypothetical protein
MADFSRFSEEDAFHAVVSYLRSQDKPGYSNYGYELYLPNVIRRHLEITHQMHFNQAEPYIRALSPHFYAAAWEMCWRGILRPGVREHGEQGTDDGAGGNGYSLTPRGREWLTQAGQYDYVPAEPGRFSKMLESFSPRFGPGYRERSQEALNCYQAHAYLACCTMCGAAAESILLALAISKNGDETAVLKDYSAQGGRTRIENLVVGKKTKPLQDEFRADINLLKYWRDNAAHGKRVGINENEAFTSLALLLRFTQFSSDHWAELTSNP